MTGFLDKFHDKNIPHEVKEVLSGRSEFDGKIFLDAINGDHDAVKKFFDKNNATIAVKNTFGRFSDDPEKRMGILAATFLLQSEKNDGKMQDYKLEMPETLRMMDFVFFSNSNNPPKNDEERAFFQEVREVVQGSKHLKQKLAAAEAERDAHAAEAGKVPELEQRVRGADAAAFVQKERADAAELRVGELTQAQGRLEDLKNQLNDQIQKLQGDLQNAKSATDEQRQKMLDAIADLRKERDKIDDLGEEIKKLEEEEERILKEKEDAQLEVVNLKKKVEEKEKEIAEKESEKENLRLAGEKEGVEHGKTKGDLSKVQGELADLRREKEGIETELTAAREAIRIAGEAAAERTERTTKAIRGFADDLQRAEDEIKEMRKKFEKQEKLRFYAETKAAKEAERADHNAKWFEAAAKRVAGEQGRTREAVEAAFQEGINTGHETGVTEGRGQEGKKVRDRFKQIVAAQAERIRLLEEEQVKLEAELNEEETDKKAAQRENDDLKREVKSLTAQVTDWEEAYNSEKNKSVAAENELEGKKAEIGKIKVQLQSVQDALRVMTQSKDASAEKVEQLEKAKQGIEQKLAEKTREAEELKTAKEAAEKNAAEIAKELAKSKRDIEKLKRDIAQKQSTITHLRTQLTEKQTDAQERAKKEGDAEGHSRGFKEGQVKGMEVGARQARQEVTAALTAAHTSETADLRTRIDALTRERDAAKRDTAKSKDELAREKKLREEAQVARRKSQEALTEVQQSLVKMQSDIAEARRDRQGAQADAQAARRERDAAVRSKGALDRQLTAEMSRAIRLEHEVDDLKGYKDAFREAVRELQKIDRLEKAKAALETEREDLRKKIRELEARPNGGKNGGRTTPPPLPSSELQKALEAANAALAAKDAELQIANATLDTAIREHARQIGEAARESDTLKTQVVGLEQGSKEWQRIADNSVREIQELIEQIEDSAEENQELAEQIRGARARISNLQDQLASTEQNAGNTYLRKALDAAERKLETLQAHSRDGKKRSAAEAAVREEKNLAKGERGSVEHAYARTTGAERRARKAEKKASLTQHALEDAGEIIERFRSDLEIEQARSAMWKKANEDLLKGRLKTLSDDYSGKLDELEQSLREVQELRDQLKAKEAELSRATTDLAGEKTARGATELERQRLQDALKAKETELGAKIEAHAVLENELVAARTALHEKGQEIRGLRDEIDLERGISGVQRELKDHAQERADRLQAEISERNRTNAEEAKRSFMKKLEQTLGEDKRVKGVRTESGIKAAIRIALDEGGKKYIGRQPDWTKPDEEIPLIVQHIFDKKIFG